MAGPSTRTERGPYAKSAARRRDILEAALELFAAHGLEGTSLTAIGTAVGASREGLRHYFATREELLLAVLDAADAHSRARSGEEPDAPFMEAFAIGVGDNLKVPGLVALYITLVASAATSTSTGTRDFFRERFATLRGALVGAIEREQAAGRVRRDLSPDVLAALVLGASDGLSMQWLLDGTTDVAAGLRLLEDLMRTADGPTARVT